MGVELNGARWYVAASMRPTPSAMKSDRHPIGSLGAAFKMGRGRERCLFQRFGRGGQFDFVYPSTRTPSTAPDGAWGGVWAVGRGVHGEGNKIK